MDSIVKTFMGFLNEATTWKAGGFPYYVDEKTGKVHVCLFLSNNPYYGGAKPQMPKGHPDAGEKPVDVAAREASEETGIPMNELRKGAIPLVSQKFKGEVSTYVMHVFGFRLSKKTKAKITDEGTGYWMELDDALKKMRNDQVHFLEKLKEKI